MSMQIQLHEFYKDSSFEVKVQYVEDRMVLHCTCSHWSGSVLKRMYRVFATLVAEAKEKGYVELITVTPNPKFCSLFGGEIIGSIDNLEIVRWKVFQQPQSHMQSQPQQP